MKKMVKIESSSFAALVRSYKKSLNYANRIVRCYVFINSLWKKNGLVGGM